ncbi:MAG TPA: hypothetical protein VM682_06035, partial [Bacillus sp. (in: firmicutes)]|nr:hypothetical protein [Bacillus sp. (in: firmicutes)]
MIENPETTITNAVLLTKEEADQAIQRHLQVHKTLKKEKDPLDDEKLQKDEGDLSCFTCYPTNEDDIPSKEFGNFWSEWFNPIYKPHHYNQNTVNFFQEARDEQDFNRRMEILKRILFTIRFKTWPYEGLPSVLSLLIETWERTFGFEQMDRLELEGRSTPAHSNYGDDIGQSTSSKNIQPYLLTSEDNDNNQEYEYREDEVIHVETSPEKNQNNGDDNENESENSSDDEGEDESRTVRPTEGIASLRGMLGFSSLSNLGSSNPWDDAAVRISSFSRRALHEEPDKKRKNPIRTPLRALSPTKKET